MQNYLWNWASATSLANEIQYLGHVHSTTGINPLPSKQQLLNWWNPQKKKKQWGMSWPCAYYSKLIKNFACIAKPLTALTHHDAKFAWTSGHHAEFNTLKMLW